VYTVQCVLTTAYAREKQTGIADVTIRQELSSAAAKSTACPSCLVGVLYDISRQALDG